MAIPELSSSSFTVLLRFALGQPFSWVNPSNFLQKNFLYVVQVPLPPLSAKLTRFIDIQVNGSGNA